MPRPLAQFGVVVLVAAQVVVLAVALRDGPTSGDPPDFPITPATVPLEALTIETALPLADPVARAWDEDARLVSALMEVVWPQVEAVVIPESIADGGAMTLVYAAGDAQLTLMMDRGSGTIFHSEVGDWSDELEMPLPVSPIARSSAIAVLAAEVTYGTSYRAACPEFRFVTRVYLSRAATDAANPVWLVSYVDERRRDRPDIQLVVDAVSGKTVDGQSAPPGCEVE